ncbi:hypothetical protein Tco_1256265 [Tanacetum coccineum]
MTHAHPKGNFVPKAVLMKSGIKTHNIGGQNFSKAVVLVNTARPINTAYPRPTVNSARTTSNVFYKAHTHVRRPFNKSTTNKNNNLKEKVNTVKGDVTTIRPKAVVSNNKGNKANAVKASACWVWRPKQKVIDHVFRHNGQSTARIVENGPNWIFDIDALTISMNYKPVCNACTKENIDACLDGKKIVPDQKYILLPLVTSDRF